jgi:hypothetical protein
LRNSTCAYYTFLSVSILNVAKAEQTHTKVKCRLLFLLARFTNRACCQFRPVKMFIKATMPLDKRNQNSELTHEVFGCLQLWVFNPKLELSTAVKCDPLFRVCVNDPLSIHILDN